MRSSSVSIKPRPLTTVDFTTVEESLKNAYRDVHSQYRQDDELEVATANHRRLAIILQTISASFGRPITALDAGCGTGRYFHCVKDVRRLVGLDLSPEMLQAATTPVRQHEITAEQIELICGNIHLASFAPQSFDFIYSLGMFGHGCPLTVELCNKFRDWLCMGGKLFFNVLDVGTFPLLTRLRKRLRRFLLPMLPERWRKAVELRRGGLPFFGLTHRSLAAILRASQFSHFRVSRRVCRSPLWSGVHLECLAWKGL